MTATLRLRRSHLAPLLGLLAVAVWSAGCGDASDETPGGAPTEAPGAERSADQPEQTFYDYRLIETQAGIKQWVLDSDVMMKFAGREDVDLVRVKMDFFREGDYFSTLVSDSGTANVKKRDVFVWGNVVVTTHDGRRLRTTELTYTNTDGLIRNDVYNVFDRGEDVITGVGLEATPDLDYIEIKHEVAAAVGDEAAADTSSAGETP